MPEQPSVRILIAGVGNELRQDDAFGIELARMLIKDPNIPTAVRVMETGIGGIHMVQELHHGFEALIILDAVSWGGDAGQLYFRSIEVRDISHLPVQEKRDLLADMHYTEPNRAMMLAKALGVLPPKVFVLGCEVALYDDFAIGMSEEVTAALPLAKLRLMEAVETLLAG